MSQHTWSWRHGLLVGAILFGALAVGRLFVWPWVHSAAASADGPHLVFDQTAVNQGKVPFGKLVKGIWVYHNTGTAPLVIAAPPTIAAIEGC